MLKIFVSIAGSILLLAGVVVAVLHYLLETSQTMKFVTLGIAALLLVVGWALFDWSRRLPREGGEDKSSGNGAK